MIRIDKMIIKIFLEMFEDAGRPLKFPEIQEYLNKLGVRILPSDIRKVLHFLERYKVIAILSPMTGFVTREGYENYIYTPHHYVDYLRKRLEEILPQALRNVEFVLKCEDCGNYMFDYTVTKCLQCGSQNLSFVSKSEILDIVNKITYDDFYTLLLIESEEGIQGVVNYLLRKDSFN